MPRDVEAEVGDLAYVYLYTIDDLRGIVEENKQGRRNEARKADRIIDDGVGEYLSHRRSLDTVETLKSLRLQADGLRAQELNKALNFVTLGPRRIAGNFGHIIHHRNFDALIK